MLCPFCKSEDTQVKDLVRLKMEPPLGVVVNVALVRHALQRLNVCICEIFLSSKQMAVALPLIEKNWNALFCSAS